MKKITMSEIAKELGISRALVSYALADKYGVSEEMKKKIITTAVELGYYKNASYNSQNKRNISVVIGAQFVSIDSFFTRIIAGIENSVRDKKYNLNLITFADSDDIEEIVSKIINFNTHGLIIIRQLEISFAKYFHKINIPKVYVDLIHPNSNFYEVRINNFGNMYSLTQYVIDKGHKKLLFVGDISWALSFEERYSGFLSAAAKEGITAQSIVGKDADGIYPFDRKESFRYLQENKKATIVCASDSVAAYLYQDIAALKLSIPDDVSIVGFDDVEHSKRMNPPLTTMHIPKFEMGRVAFELLDEQYRVPGSISKVVCLNSYLIERNSLKNL